jgi:hypothetical protein
VKTLCLSYYAYVFSSTKLEIKEEQVSEGGRGRGLGQGVGGRNDPNNAHVNK